MRRNTPANKSERDGDHSTSPCLKKSPVGPTQPAPGTKKNVERMVPLQTGMLSSLSVLRQLQKRVSDRACSNLFTTEVPHAPLARLLPKGCVLHGPWRMAHTDLLQTQPSRAPLDQNAVTLSLKPNAQDADHQEWDVCASGAVAVTRRRTSTKASSPTRATIAETVTFADERGKRGEWQMTPQAEQHGTMMPIAMGDGDWRPSQSYALFARLYTSRLLTDPG